MHSARLLARVRVPLVVVSVLVGAACASGDEPVKLTPAQASAISASNAATARPSPMPNPHSGPAAGAAVATAPQSAGALQFSVPAGWIVQTPTSAMRKAQFQLPKEEGDPEDAQLVLFYFGGEGGSVDANLARWEGEFEQPDGRSTEEVLATTTRTVNAMKVTEVAISGTFVPSMMPGQPAPVRREGWSMLGAIVESPSGPYFAKLTGPAATVSRWEASFREWVSSLQPTKG